jgi:hypothetical protein
MARSTRPTIGRKDFLKAVRKAVRSVRSHGIEVPRTLTSEVYDVAKTMKRFQVGSYEMNGQRCLIGEVRHRRGESDCIPDFEDAAEGELGSAIDRYVVEAAGITPGFFEKPVLKVVDDA